MCQSDIFLVAIFGDFLFSSWDHKAFIFHFWPSQIDIFYLHESYLCCCRSCPFFPQASFEMMTNVSLTFHLFSSWANFQYTVKAGSNIYLKTRLQLLATAYLGCQETQTWDLMDFFQANQPGLRACSKNGFLSHISLADSKVFSFKGGLYAILQWKLIWIGS